MESKVKVNFLAFCLLAVLAGSSAVTINRVQKLHDDYVVSWTADLTEETIQFTVEARTHGYVGFGLSPQGGMVNADLIIGGVKDNGEAYFTDRFATGKKEPTIDKSQDWKLILAKENTTHTTLVFLRRFNTCDDEDLPIKNDTTKFIWSMGATDIVEHHAQRGAAQVNILDPAGPSFDISKFQPWDIKVNTRLPNQDTAYWCTMHKSPVSAKKRHIVGFRVMLDNALSLEHNHHLVLHHCSNDPNNTELYESFLADKHPGGECYDDDGSGIQEVVQYCNSFYYVWAKGGDPLLLPENVGLPMNENGIQEYFMLEIHYDNPKIKPSLQYETGLQVYTSDIPRPDEAGVLTVGHDTAISLMIPPNTTDYVISGHCSSSCTASRFPKGGISVFNVLLHSHLAGRKIKLRHFRDGTELPWLAQDDQYDFNYQQNRPLAENRQVLPGDHLTTECTDDSTHLNPPAAVVGGLKTKNEMCESFLIYWPRLPNLEVCYSLFDDTDFIFGKLGIEEFDEASDMRDPTVTKPAKLNGKKFSEVASDLTKWTPELIAEFQQKSRFNDHFDVCVGYADNQARFLHMTSRNAVKELGDRVTYPKDYIPYVPPEEKCDSGSLSLVVFSMYTVSAVTLVSLKLI